MLQKKKEEKTKQNTEKHAKRKFKVPFAKRNEESQIPIEKEALSSEKREGAIDHKNTTLGKSDGVSDEGKLKADNIIPIDLLDIPSPLKVYRHKEFERTG